MMELINLNIIKRENIIVKNILLMNPISKMIRIYLKLLKRVRRNIILMMTKRNYLLMKIISQMILIMNQFHRIKIIPKNLLDWILLKKCHKRRMLLQINYPIKAVIRAKSTIKRSLNLVMVLIKKMKRKPLI